MGEVDVSPTLEKCGGNFGKGKREKRESRIREGKGGREGKRK